MFSGIMLTSKLARVDFLGDLPFHGIERRYIKDRNDVRAEIQEDLWISTLLHCLN